MKYFHSFVIYIALYKDENHSLNVKGFLLLLLKRAVLLYNSNNILKTPLGIALRAGNRFKCL